jgi:hypothetical protein
MNTRIKISRNPWIWLCLSVCIGSCAKGQRDYQLGPDPADPSVFYYKPSVMVSGYKTYNGAAYDKSRLWLGEKVRLVLPDAATRVIADCEPNELVIYMEKEVAHHSHSHESNWPIPGARKNMGCAIKLEKGCLFVGTFGEGSYMEGGQSIELVLHVPKDFEVERRPGLVGGFRGKAGSERPPGLINPGPGDARPLLNTLHPVRPGCWIAPPNEDGWHEIPVVPDLERRAARERGGSG